MNRTTAPLSSTIIIFPYVYAVYECYTCTQIGGRLVILVTRCACRLSSSVHLSVYLSLPLSSSAFERYRAVLIRSTTLELRDHTFRPVASKLNCQVRSVRPHHPDILIHVSEQYDMQASTDVSIYIFVFFNKFVFLPEFLQS